MFTSQASVFFRNKQITTSQSLLFPINQQCLFQDFFITQVGDQLFKYSSAFTPTWQLGSTFTLIHLFHILLILLPVIKRPYKVLQGPSSLCQTFLLETVFSLCYLFLLSKFQQSSSPNNSACRNEFSHTQDFPGTYNPFHYGHIQLVSIMIALKRAKWSVWWQEQPSWKRPGSPLGQQTEHELEWHCIVMEKQGRKIRSWTASAVTLLAETEMWPSHPTWCLSGSTNSTVSSSGPHYSGKMWAGWRRSKREPWRRSKCWWSCEEKTKGVGSFHPGEQKHWGTLFQYLKGGNKVNRGALHEELHGEGKGQQVQGEVASGYKNSVQWEQLITGCGRIIISGGF